MNNLYDTALRLLVRREHSATELKRKLLSKGKYTSTEIIKVVEQLTLQGLQSDIRFAEVYVKHRIELGYGPRRIELELKELGIGEIIINRYLSQDKLFWEKQMLDFWNQCPNSRKIDLKDFKSKARNFNFLLRRGFIAEQIRELIG